MQTDAPLQNAAADGAATIVKPAKRAKKPSGGRCVMQRSLYGFLDFLNSKRAGDFLATGWIESVKRHTTEYAEARGAGKTEVYTIPAVPATEEKPEGIPAKELSLDEYLTKKQEEEISAIKLHLSSGTPPAIEAWLTEHAELLENVPSIKLRHAESPALRIHGSWFKAPANKGIFYGWKVARKAALKANLDSLLRHVLTHAADLTIYSKKVTIGSKEIKLAFSALSPVVLAPKAVAAPQVSVVAIVAKAPAKRKAAAIEGGAPPAKKPRAAPVAKSGAGKGKGKGKRGAGKVGALKKAAARTVAGRGRAIKVV